MPFINGNGMNRVTTFSTTTHEEHEQDQDGTAVPSWSCSQAVSKPVWHIPLLCVQWKTLDDGQRNCPKHVEFHSKNKSEKLVHLVGFSVRNVTRCTVTWTSNCIVYIKTDSFCTNLDSAVYLAWWTTPIVRFPLSIKKSTVFWKKNLKNFTDL